MCSHQPLDPLVGFLRPLHVGVSATLVLDIVFTRSSLAPRLCGFFSLSLFPLGVAFPPFCLTRVEADWSALLQAFFLRLLRAAQIAPLA